MSAPSVAVVGVGHSKVYRRAEEPLGKLAVDAARAAIADAGLHPSDIDGISTSPVHPAAGVPHVEGIHMVGTYFMIRALRLDPSYSDQGGAILTQSFVHAVNAVAAGACRHALVFRALHNPDGRYGRADIGVAGGPDQWALPYGSTGPTTIAQELRAYMNRYGGTREQLGTFVCRNREQGLKNENSYWRQYRPETLTLEEYLTARPISEPLGMHDCDIPIQGAAAVVVTSGERARDLTDRPAYVLGTAISPEFFSQVGYPDTVESQLDAGRRMARHLYRNAGVTAADVDVANLYDGYSANVPFWADSMGLCEEGAGLPWVAEPHIPLNTSGGNLGNGRMHGAPHLIDGAQQVMRRSGARQVDNARISLVTIGGTHHAGGVVFADRPAA
ncbi:thiolase family protein [Pseudonocardia sp. RS010]|uniref:thiolase family protein n=1 Tax=Pseudonocardia sp. RS010 TaxID=3385979 RepID=UPI0039A333C0